MGMFYVFLLVIACAPFALFFYRKKVSVASSLVALIALGGMMSGCGAVQIETASVVEVIKDDVDNDDDSGEDNDGDSDNNEDENIAGTVIDIQAGERAPVLWAETTFSVPSREDAERVGDQMGCRNVRRSAAGDRDQYVCIR